MTPFHLLPEVLSDVDFAPAKAAKPSTRWRNKWLSVTDDIRTTGEHLPQGEEYWGSHDWPSKDAAESYAQEQIAGKVHEDKYLGAFPIEGDA